MNSKDKKQDGRFRLEIIGNELGQVTNKKNIAVHDTSHMWFKCSQML